VSYWFHLWLVLKRWSAAALQEAAGGSCTLRLLWVAGAIHQLDTPTTPPPFLPITGAVWQPNRHRRTLCDAAGGRGGLCRRSAPGDRSRRVRGGEAVVGAAPGLRALDVRGRRAAGLGALVLQVARLSRGFRVLGLRVCALVLQVARLSRGWVLCRA
jgi:hypothetical protein